MCSVVQAVISELRNIVDEVAVFFLRVKLCQTSRCVKFKVAAVSERIQWSGGTSATCSAYEPPAVLYRWIRDEMPISLQ